MIKLCNIVTSTFVLGLGLGLELSSKPHEEKSNRQCSGVHCGGILFREVCCRRKSLGDARERSNEKQKDVDGQHTILSVWAVNGIRAQTVERKERS